MLAGVQFEEGRSMSTQAIHAGWDAADGDHGAVAPPIFATSAYAHPEHASLKNLFARKCEGFAYSRSGNPPPRSWRTDRKSVV